VPNEDSFDTMKLIGIVQVLSSSSAFQFAVISD
jgi:hypothetical protein